MGSDVLRTLRSAAVGLDRLSDAEVAAGLTAALDRWRSPSGPLAGAVERLAAVRRESPEMLRFGLDRLLKAHERRALEGWVAGARAEAARAAAEHDPGGTSPAMDALRGPAVVAQVLAGNVAGLALPATLEGLLARSAVLLKPASEEPILPFLIKDTLDEVAPELGNAVAVESWKGGDEGIEARFLDEADFVIATGGAGMTASLQRRISVPHLFYGPRFTAAVIGMDWLHARPEWWEEAAREIVLWDQKGCLSPRIIFAAGDPARFARRLAEAMAAWEARWPAPPRPMGEAAAVHAFRAPYAMADGKTSGYLGPEGTAWTVAWDTHPTLDLGPPARTVRVTRRPSPRGMAALLAEAGDALQGLALEKLGSRDGAWRRSLSRLEVPRVAPLTRIQDPPAGWRADGRSGLSELFLRGFQSGRTAHMTTHEKSGG